MCGSFPDDDVPAGVVEVPDKVPPDPLPDPPCDGGISDVPLLLKSPSFEEVSTSDDGSPLDIYESERVPEPSPFTDDEPEGSFIPKQEQSETQITVTAIKTDNAFFTLYSSS